MQINASSLLKISSPAGGGGNRSALVKQIRKLEQKKQKLLEKLGAAAGVSSSGSSADSLGFTRAQVNLPSDGERAAGEAVAEGLRKIAVATPASPSSDAGAMDPEDYMEPKEIMKMITLIDAQIMALKQRLSDEEKDQLAAATAEDEKDGPAVGPAEGAAVVVDVESAAPAGGGQVDGYA